MVNRMVGDYQVCINEADAFLDVAKSCMNDVGEFLFNKMYPCIVNSSFSCELYLKAIMIKRSPNDEFSRGHDLEALFNCLDADDRGNIELKYNNICQKPLSELLNESGKAFEEWRYALERSVSICVTGIIAFADALKQYNSSI